MEHFTPISAAIGGFLIGLAAIGYLYFNGKTCGISGIVEGFVPPFSPELPERALFVGGLFAGGALLSIFYPLAYTFDFGYPLYYNVIGGLLVGFGTRFGGGCTSGHGVCGVGRLSIKAIVATLVFLLTGIATASIVHLLGGL